MNQKGRGPKKPSGEEEKGGVRSEDVVAYERRRLQTEETSRRGSVG